MPTFSTTRRVPFTSRQMFDLVADVEQYPKFLPLCEALIVKKRERAGEVETLVAEMTVGYYALRESFTSRVVLDASTLHRECRFGDIGRGEVRIRSVEVALSLLWRALEA